MHDGPTQAWKTMLNFTSPCSFSYNVYYLSSTACKVLFQSFVFPERERGKFNQTRRKKSLRGDWKGAQSLQRQTVAVRGEKKTSLTPASMVELHLRWVSAAFVSCCHVATTVPHLSLSLSLSWGLFMKGNVIFSWPVFCLFTGCNVALGRLSDCCRAQSLSLSFSFCLSYIQYV